MIRASFVTRAGEYCGFSVTGHSGLFEYGTDVLCAGVSSSVMMAANTITEVMKVGAETRVLDNKISLCLPKTLTDSAACKVIEGLKLHLQELQKDYPDGIQVTKDREEIS